MKKHAPLMSLLSAPVILAACVLLNAGCRSTAPEMEITRPLDFVGHCIRLSKAEAMKYEILRPQAELCRKWVFIYTDRGLAAGQGLLPEFEASE